MNRLAIYPGSFDPITNGHHDVILRARKLFDRLTIAVAENDQKTGLFSLDERVELIRQTLGSSVDGVDVVRLDGLLVDYAHACGACAIVRGLRAISDFEFEFQMALMNRQIEPEVETIFMMPKEECTYLSSRIVKEIARLGGQVDKFVPPCVVGALRRKLLGTPPG